MAIQPSTGVSDREPRVFVNNQGFCVWTQRRILPQPLLQANCLVYWMCARILSGGSAELLSTAHSLGKSLSLFRLRHPFSSKILHEMKKNNLNDNVIYRKEENLSTFHFFCRSVI
jgi:hypothetical protein